MPLLLPNCKMTFVCGPVSSGKTHLIKQWLSTDARHVIFDGTGEFLEDNSREQIWASPKKLWERLKANPYCFQIVYTPGRDRLSDFSWALNCLWWTDAPSKTFVCDEFHEICPVSMSNDDVEMMLRFARHNKLGFVGASQRIADVSKLYTSGCRVVILFHTLEARDLEAIQDRWRCAKMVENLRPLLYDDDTETTKQVPQCVVIIKGQKPFIYDFASDSQASEATDPVSDDPELDDSEPREGTV